MLNHHQLQTSVTNKRAIMPGRAWDFSFPATQRKAKKISLSVLSGSAVKIKEPFRVTIKPPFSGMGIDRERKFAIFGQTLFIFHESKRAAS